MSEDVIDHMQAARANCQRFANDHKVIFEDHGEVGFGRPCVGFLRGQGYVDINPTSKSTFEDLWPPDHRLYAPAGVRAYHKHACLCVLTSDDTYDTAILQLDAWVRHLEAQGPLELVEYGTGAAGLQALISGVIGYALRFKA